MMISLMLAVAWAGSEWISVPNAPMAPAEWRVSTVKRAADGVSWFTAKTVNEKNVRSAKWTTTGLGVYEAYVNGKRIANDVLRPGYTSPSKTKVAFTDEVTRFLKLGKGEENVLSAAVSAGWWSDGIIQYLGKKPAFRGVLEIVYEDGSEGRFVTDCEHWQGAIAGPILHAGIYDGEEYDARIAAPHEGGAGFGAVEANREFEGEIVGCVGAEVVLREDLAIAKGATKVVPGKATILDFGQNASAVPRFRFRAKRGTELVALPAEMLNDCDGPARGCDGPKGSVYRANLRSTNTNMRVKYVFAGEGTEEYMPRFTFFGYRYLALEATDAVEIESIESVPVTSIARGMETGSLVTGDASVNRLIANVYWGQLSNYLSIPTDCPQRNERQGWLADTQIFTEAGAFNADTRRFFRKWMRDVRDTIGTNASPIVMAPTPWPVAPRFAVGWTDAMVIVPYQIWRHFGDTDILADNFDAMAGYLDVVAGCRYRTEALPKPSNQYADWLSFEKYEQWLAGHNWRKAGNKTTRPISPEERTLMDFLGASYWLMDARMMEKAAKALGRDEKKYRQMIADAERYIRATFFAAEDGMIVPALRGMQTPALFALKDGVMTASAKAATIAELRRNFAENGNRLKTGFLGTSILMDTLTENGMADIAYELLLQHEFPSWLYSVDQGATTIWERWNGYTKAKGFGPVDMNSFNHYAYGAVLAWMYKTMAGIASDEDSPGFRNVIMSPRPDRRLGFVKAEYRSAAGMVKSAWRYEGERWIWEFSIPEGATATVRLPDGSAARHYKAGEYVIELTR